VAGVSKLKGTAAAFPEEFKDYMAGLEREIESLRMLRAREIEYGAMERRTGIGGLKAWLAAPDWMIPALEAFCYGETQEIRTKAGSIILRFMAGKAVPR
jgi:hypothetical protein